ncbi:MAG: bifunctional glutamate N-acetyltransferase/amino-acid acetyltransferase ArgJ [Thermoactinomyces sp.]
MKTEAGLNLEKKAFQILKNPSIASPKGFGARGIHAGIKRKKKDLGLLWCEVPASAAAVYTVNAFQAPPIKVTKESIGKENKLQAVVVNSGNANACTGQHGLENARQMREKTASLLNIPSYLVGVASTGVIGVYLPIEKICSGLEKLAAVRESDSASFAEAILTTDTFTKQVTVGLEIDGKTVCISGAAKGSGMIHPNMATMLAFITTDANIDSVTLQSLLWTTTDDTFNMITVDGDTSTNDMVLVMASGLAGNRPLVNSHPEWKKFQAAFHYVCEALARMIARDGEGASHLIQVKVEGARSMESARKIAKTVVASNLVKTAVYGADANWGRVICAAGYADPALALEKIDMYLGPVQVVKKGMAANYDEEEATNVLKQEVVEIRLCLNTGKYETMAWGCDLTYEYVRINASYRT